MTWRVKAPLIACIVCAVILIAFALFLIVHAHLGYFLFGYDVTENYVEYEVDPLKREANVATIILKEDSLVSEVVIPDRLENGISVKNIGYITKGETWLCFELEGKRWSSFKGTALEEDALSDKITDYYITIVLGEKIKEATCLTWWDDQRQIYEIADTGEYIRLNISYEVSPENKDYYSQDGKIYRK